MFFIFWEKALHYFFAKDTKKQHKYQEKKFN